MSEQQPGPSSPSAPRPPGEAPSTPASTSAPAAPGRPPRTTNGLIGAMIITLLVIGAFVALRAFSRTQPDIRPQSVDYLGVASAAHDAGHRVVYPARLPRGWKATSVDYVPGRRSPWGIGMLTDNGDFVGVHQEDAPLDGLLTTYVDEKPQRGGEIRVAGSVAPRWREYADQGGDHAFAAVVHGDEVLVYGSAPVPDLRRTIGLLTADKP